jgi:hypothetical protein
MADVIGRSLAAEGQPDVGDDPKLLAEQVTWTWHTYSGLAHGFAAGHNSRSDDARRLRRRSRDRRRYRSHRLPQDARRPRRLEGGYRLC